MRYDISEYFVTEAMITSALDEIADINSSEERMGIAYFLEKVFNLRYERNGKYYFYKHKRIFLEWIQNANSKAAYAYSRLINTLRNTDIKQYRKFVREINWTSLQESMIRDNNLNLYSWGDLYNRLTDALPEKEYLLIGKMLECAIEKFCNTASTFNIEGLTYFLCHVMHTNPEYIHNMIKILIPKYAGYFKKDMSQAIYLFNFDFLVYICGMSLLGGHTATKFEKKSEELIVSVILEKEFAEVIMKCSSRNWHTIQPIMNLIGHYDRGKAKRIVDLIDVGILTEKSKDSWRKNQEISELCDILYIGNCKVAREFIKVNLDKIQTMYSSFIMMSPECAIDAFDRGVEIDLLTEHWWDVSLFALQELNKIGSNKTKEILLKNVPKIIERINSIRVTDFEERYCLEFLKLISKIEGDVFNMIVFELDIEKIKINLSRGVIKGRKKKQIEIREEQFYELIKC